ncbi:prepilin peptidase [Specibacter cremeus]|uniref:prepilin peptidase n=1 Tax=Specibacter cremeus TaxID=1629051 RepID=UPI001F0C7707|nr:A24 family peptidase [Specibacter cremeus]
MRSALAGLWGPHPVAFWLVLAACLYFVWMAVRLAGIDIRHHLLPNRIVYPSALAALVLLAGAALAAGDPGAALRTVSAGVVLFIAYLVLNLVYPAGLGLGDVKLAFVLGLYLGFTGWPAVFWATALAFVLAGLWGVVLLASRRGTGNTAIPFGPFMLAGAAAVLVGG